MKLATTSGAQAGTKVSFSSPAWRSLGVVRQAYDKLASEPTIKWMVRDELMTEKAETTRKDQSLQNVSHIMKSSVFVCVVFNGTSAQNMS